MTQRSILAISGKMRSGKDTFATQFLHAAGLGWTRAPFAHALKLEVAAKHGISLEALEADKETYRPELIAWGRTRRDEDPLYWVKRGLETFGNLVVSDLRYPNELQALREAGALFVRVEAVLTARQSRGVIIEDWASENQLDGIAVGPGGWDWMLDNNGTQRHFEERSALLIPEILTQFAHNLAAA